MDKLKISNNTKDKVAEYIRKYMSRFGEVYKRKTNGIYTLLYLLKFRLNDFMYSNNLK